MADKIPGESIIRVIASNTETKQDHKQGHEPATEGKKGFEHLVVGFSKSRI